MGLIGDVLSVVLGGGRNAIRETVEVFRPNAEAQDLRESKGQAAALAQFSSEFSQARPGYFDRFMNAINRLPRPMLALGTLALFVSAMTDPIWFAQRMQGVALVPEPLWWLMAVIVSFYFGARQQFKAQDFQKSLALTIARMPQVSENIRDLGMLQHRESHATNAALDDWRKSNGW